MLYAIGVTLDGTPATVYGWIVQDRDSSRYAVTTSFAEATRYTLADAGDLCPRLAQAGYDSPVIQSVPAWLDVLAGNANDFRPE